MTENTTLTYLVTGANSFFGLALCRHLTRQGHCVVAVLRRPSEQLAEMGVCQVVADMSDYGDLYHDVPQADVWVNLAWQGTGHDGRDQQEVQQANVVHSVAAMYCAHKMQCRLFVQAGSQAEYGTVLTTITEKTPCQPFSEYGKAKLQTMWQLARLSDKLGIKYLHLRIFSLFGPGDHPWTLVMSSLEKMLAGQSVPLSDCTQQWNFLSVDDAARQTALLCRYALSHNDFCHDVFNVASDDTRPLRSFVEEMHRLTSSESRLIYGAVTPQHTVCLQPDVSKLRQTIGFVTSESFGHVINSIIGSLKQHDKT